MTNIAEKLLHIQSVLKAPKGQYNSFSKFKYRSAEDILEAVKPLNTEQGLLLTLTDEAVVIGEWHYIKALARITDGKESHEVTAYARESEIKKGMDSSQITGTASSYARKYALNGLYLIDDTKDADTDAYQNQNNNQNNQGDNHAIQQITQQQVGNIKLKVMQFAKARNQTDQAVYDVLKITNIEQLTKKQAESIERQLDMWLSKVNEG